MADDFQYRKKFIYRDITSPEYKRTKRTKKVKETLNQAQTPPEIPSMVEDEQIDNNRNEEPSNNNNEQQENIDVPLNNFISDIINSSPNQPTDDKPLFDGKSKMTEKQFQHRFLSFIVQHKPTKTLLREILKLLGDAAPEKHLVPENLQVFNKVLNPKEHTIHHYCEDCQFIYEDPEELYCPICDQLRKIKVWRYKGGKAKGAKKKQPRSYFMTFSVRGQLKLLLERDGNLQAIQQSDRVASKTTISDIKDGSYYQSLYHGFLDNKNNFSLIGFTDGVQPFNSSCKTLWPVFLAVNELPIQKRFKAKNIILAALYFGKEKPNVSGFLHTTVEELQLLFSKGITIKTSTRDICCRGAMICGVFDTVARSWVMCMKQFNYAGGKNKNKTNTSGCGRCVAVTVREGKRTLYKYAPITERKSGEVKKALQEHTNQDNCFKGVSVFWYLPCYDFFLSTIIDAMHCFWEGIMKTFLKRWFDKSHSTLTGSQRATKMHHTLDKLLLTLKLPSETKRSFRSYKDHGAYWKASELKNFMLIAFPCIGSVILPYRYYGHFMKIVNAATILYQREIKRTQLSEASKLIEDFCKQVEELYDSTMESFNVHQARHLTDDTERFGPLWTHSAFVFESMNQEILKMCHGTTKLLEQVQWFQQVQETLSHFDEQRIHTPSNNVTSHIRITDAGSSVKLQPKDIDDIKSYLVSERIKDCSIAGSATKYTAALLHQHTVLHSTSRDEPAKANNSCVQLSNNSYVLVQGFYAVKITQRTGSECTIAIAEVTPLKKIQDLKISDFVYEATLGRRQFINIKDIVGKAIWLSYDVAEEGTTTNIVKKHFVVDLQTREEV